MGGIDKHNKLYIYIQESSPMSCYPTPDAAPTISIAPVHRNPSSDSLTTASDSGNRWLCEGLQATK